MNDGTGSSTNYSDLYKNGFFDSSRYNYNEGPSYNKNWFTTIKNNGVWEKTISTNCWLSYSTGSSVYTRSAINFVSRPIACANTSSIKATICYNSHASGVSTYASIGITLCYCNDGSTGALAVDDFVGSGNFGNGGIGDILGSSTITAALNASNKSTYKWVIPMMAIVIRSSISSGYRDLLVYSGAGVTGLYAVT